MSPRQVFTLLGFGSMFLVAACAVGTPGEDDPATDPPAASERPDPPPKGVIGTPIAIVPHEMVDTEAGAMCLYPSGRFKSPFALPEVVSIDAGERLRARIPYASCLSSSCDIHRIAECVFRWDGDILRLHSYLSFDEIPGPPCTMDCQQLVAECESEPLPEGEVRLRFGDHERRLMVPSKIDACEPIACERDRECAEMCGFDNQGQGMCQPWAQLGEACNGYMPAELQRRCAPGLACIHQSKLVDMPGTCLAVCEKDADCETGVCTYIGEDHRVCLTAY